MENTLKGSGTEKRGEETKIFKKGANLDQGMDALKRDWLEPSRYQQNCKSDTGLLMLVGIKVKCGK